jgi:hypothetical protein
MTCKRATRRTQHGVREHLRRCGIRAGRLGTAELSHATSPEASYGLTVREQRPGVNAARGTYR